MKTPAYDDREVREVDDRADAERVHQLTRSHRPDSIRGPPALGGAHASGSSVISSGASSPSTAGRGEGRGAVSQGAAISSLSPSARRRRLSKARCWLTWQPRSENTSSTHRLPVGSVVQRGEICILGATIGITELLAREREIRS